MKSEFGPDKLMVIGVSVGLVSALAGLFGCLFGAPTWLQWCVFVGSIGGIVAMIISQLWSIWRD